MGSKRSSFSYIEHVQTCARVASAGCQGKSLLLCYFVSCVCLCYEKVHDFGIGEMQPEITIPDVMKQGMKDAIDSNQVFSFFYIKQNISNIQSI